MIFQKSKHSSQSQIIDELLMWYKQSQPGKAANIKMSHHCQTQTALKSGNYEEGQNRRLAV